MKIYIMRQNEVSNVDNLIALLSAVQKQYGNINKICLYGYDEEYRRINNQYFLSVSELQEKLSMNDYLAKEMIECTTSYVNNKSYLISIGIKERKMVISEFEPQISNDPVSTDTNYTYYQFDNGTIVRYDNNTKIYSYLKNGEWITNNRLIDLIYDATSNYAEIDYEKNSRSR